MRPERRHLASVDGNATIEFAILVPIVFSIFLVSIELGVYTIRQTFLERGLDIAVREIRLGTDTNITHDGIKTSICANAGFLPDCETSLRLEMIPTSISRFQVLDTGADCIDRSQPVAPVRQFQQGGENQLMLLRACYNFNPVFPTTGLGRGFAKDGAGKVNMIAISAFVQEPL